MSFTMDHLLSVKQASAYRAAENHCTVWQVHTALNKQLRASKVGNPCVLPVLHTLIWQLVCAGGEQPRMVLEAGTQLVQQCTSTGGSRSSSTSGRSFIWWACQCCREYTSTGSCLSTPAIPAQSTQILITFKKTSQTNAPARSTGQTGRKAGTLSTPCSATGGKRRSPTRQWPQAPPRTAPSKPGSEWQAPPATGQWPGCTGQASRAGTRTRVPSGSSCTLT